MRAIAISLCALILMFAASIVSFVVINVPVGARYLAIESLAPKCKSPEHLPRNAGNLIIADVRQPGSGTVLSTVPRETLVAATISELRDKTEQSRDLVIYVHGFATSREDANCAGNVLLGDLAALPAYAARGGPDVLVFSWPGEFCFVCFSAAQDNAVLVGPYLGEILQGLAGRRVILVAHSLGAEVVMAAAEGLPTQGIAPPLAGVLLIEGAIPAVSIRDWRSTFTETHPYRDVANVDPQRSAYVETEKGSGRFVSAAAKAAHLVVTTAGDDIPLSRAFAIHTSFSAMERNQAMIPPQIGGGYGDGINTLAIGTPFPKGTIHRHQEDLMPDLLEDSATPVPQFERGTRRSRSNLPHPSLPSRVMNSRDWEIEYHVPHPSYHEIRLDQGQWWRLLYDWHGVMKDDAVRLRILRESWAIFAGRSS